MYRPADVQSPMALDQTVSTKALIHICVRCSFIAPRETLRCETCGAAYCNECGTDCDPCSLVYTVCPVCHPEIDIEDVVRCCHTHLVQHYIATGYLWYCQLCKVFYRKRNHDSASCIPHRVTDRWAVFHILAAEDPCIADYWHLMPPMPAPAPAPEFAIAPMFGAVATSGAQPEEGTD